MPIKSRRTDPKSKPKPAQPNQQGVTIAAAMFRALGDPARLQILTLVAQQERTVGELAAIQGDSLPLISQRLRWLKTERLVVARRQGKNVFYAAADQHVVSIVNQALEHASEPQVNSNRET